jgi:hypothetical protein
LDRAGGNAGWNRHHVGLGDIMAQCNAARSS